MTKPATPTWAEPHDSRSHLSFAVGVDFAQKLRTVMDQAGLSASDLARRIWGDAPPTAAGYVSAKNRDRISKYLAGKVLPDGATLKLLADALNVAEESLAPQVVGSRLEREHPEVRLTVIAGHRDRVHLTVNTAMALSKAIQIITLIEAKDDGPGLELREPPPEDTPPLSPALLKHTTPDALSIEVFKEALKSVENRRLRMPELSPAIRAEFEAAILEALANTRKKIGEDRNSIEAVEAQERLKPRAGSKRSRQGPTDETIRAT